MYGVYCWKRKNGSVYKRAISCWILMTSNGEDINGYRQGAKVGIIITYFCIFNFVIIN